MCEFLRYHRRLLHCFHLTERSTQYIRITPNKVYIFWKVNKCRFHIILLVSIKLLYKELELVYYAWRRFAIVSRVNINRSNLTPWSVYGLDGKCWVRIAEYIENVEYDTFSADFSAILVRYTATKPPRPMSSFHRGPSTNLAPSGSTMHFMHFFRVENVGYWKCRVWTIWSMENAEYDKLPAMN